MAASEVIIIHPKSKMNPQILGDLRKCGNYVSFGEELREIKLFESKIGGLVDRLNISRDIEELFPGVARAFSDRIAALAKIYGHNDFWWLSPYTEKNGWPSEHITLECVLEWLRINKKVGSIALVTSRPYFCFCLNKDIPGAKIKVYGKTYFLFSMLKKYLKVVVDALRFVRQSAARQYWMRLLGVKQKQFKKLDSQDVYLLRVYVNEKLMSADGSFADSHFGDTATLKGYIEQKGYSVVLEPNLSSLKTPQSFYKWVTAFGKDAFWMPEAFLSVIAYYKALMAGFKNILFYHGLGFRIVAQAESFYLFDVASGYIKAQLPVVLRKQGFCPKVVLFNWENKGYEKYMQLLFKKSLPDTRVKGYMNAFSSPILPEMLAYPEENSIAPFPDELICKSRYIYDNLACAGVNSSILRIGPALRDLYIFNERGRDGATADDKKNILVCMPLSHSISMELIELVKDLLAATREFKIILKPHPFFGTDQITAKLSEYIDGGFLRVSSRPMSEEVRLAEYFVYCGPTSTACEASVLGKMVFRYVSADRLSLGALYYDKDACVYDFNSAGELLRALVDMKKPPEPDEDRMRYFYEPLNPDLSNLEVFS